MRASPVLSPHEEIERLELLCALDRARLRLLVRRRSLASRSMPKLVGAGMRLGSMMPGVVGRIIRSIQFADTSLLPLLRRFL